MDTKVACLLLIILGALTVQGAVSGNKRTNPLHARQWGDEECMNNGDEMCYPYGQPPPPGYEPCPEKYCVGGSMCYCRSW